MKISLALATVLVAGSLVAAPATAANVATLTATYDPFADNTSFTVTNLSAGTLTGVTLTTDLGPDSVGLADLSPGASETYAFSEFFGGFLPSPHNVGVPDTTQYDFSVISNGNLLASNLFSPNSNLTGGYVDFLGNTCPFTTCTGVTASAVVAAVAGAAVGTVPEPPSLLLLGAGVIGIALTRRRSNRMAG